MAHRRNHVTSTCYLRGWAGADGYLRVVTPPAIGSEPATPKSVGYRIKFWGQDAYVRRQLEEALARIESDVGPALRQLPGSWPPVRGQTEWFALTYLVAIHILRAPGTQRWISGIQEALIPRQLDRFPHWNDEQVTHFIGTVTSDVWRAQLFGDQLTQVAAFVASMHWALIEFDETVVATSDQPVSIVPLLEQAGPGARSPVPGGGLTNCEEIR